MSNALDALWNKARDLQQQAQYTTSNNTILSIINDLVEEIEVALSEDLSEEIDLDFNNVHEARENY